MRPEPGSEPVSAPARPLWEAIAEHAAAHDADGSFPREALAELAARGHLRVPPIEAGRMDALLTLLAEVGRGDLNVGRIFEGHVNARLLIARDGTPEQRRWFARPGAGGVLGVWNTDAPTDPLRLVDGVLMGGKSFASGVDGIDHAIVTVDGREDDATPGRRMIIAPVRDLAVDRSWWNPLGMRASGSHVADFTGLRVAADWHLGRAGDYLAEPWFSAGAIRFVAVQVGGMHGILDVATAHLGRAGRAANPYQAHRLARMGVAVETGYLWLGRVAAAWEAAAREAVPAARARYLLAAANGARLAVETAALAVLEEAERAIGAQGLIAPHPFERRMRDLRVYLRQPNPDGAAAAFGEAVASAGWTAGARA